MSPLSLSICRAGPEDTCHIESALTSITITFSLILSSLPLFDFNNPSYTSTDRQHRGQVKGTHPGSAGIVSAVTTDGKWRIFHVKPLRETGWRHCTTSALLLSPFFVHRFVLVLTSIDRFFSPCINRRGHLVESTW